MQYIEHYLSPLGSILIAIDDEGLTGLWFDNQKYYATHLDPNYKEEHHEILEQTKRWLDMYFSGKNPDFIPPIHMIGTKFQKRVWNHLLRIPYGETTTYGEISKAVALDWKIDRMSAQAIGQAVGHNEISIIIPCHRVVGRNGSLTGYAGGINRKYSLLQLEGIDMSNFTVPSHGTAI